MAANAAAPAAPAAADALLAPQWHHAAWAVKDGAPADIWAMAQGPRGFLWLGTGNGLYQFDGVRFERAALPAGASLPSSNITALTMLPDGSVWIGYYNGGASVLKGGHFVHYGAREGFPGGMVQTFARDPDGHLWAATGGGLMRFAEGRWQHIDAAWGYPAARADWLVFDRAGTLWVVTGEELVFLRSGARRFESTGEKVDRQAVLGCAPDGTLWLSDGLHGTRALPGLSADHPHVAASARQPTPGAFARVKRLLFDREGHLWGTDANDGGVYRTRSLREISDGRSLDATDLRWVFKRRNGLTSDVAVPMVQDVEGDVWVGTNLGLDSFRINNVKVLPDIVVSPSSHYGVSVDRHGTVWVANNGALFRIDSRGAARVPGAFPDALDIHAAPDDALWLNSKSGLWKLERGVLRAIPLPDDAARGNIQALTADATDGLWIAVLNRGAFHWNGERWRHWDGDPVLATLTPTAMAMDAAGRIWFGYPGSLLARLDGDTVRRFSSVDGLRVGNVTTLTAAGDAVWVGGESGLARSTAGGFQSLSMAGIDVLTGISGIARANNGDIWVNASRGVVRIEASSLDRAFAQASRHAEVTVFDDRDGLPGIALQAIAVPSAVADAQGRVWFATNQGVAWLDPGHLYRNRLPPPVLLRSLTANGRVYPVAAAALELPPRVANVRLDYTATSLSMPDRVRFRYRLDGVDDRWQDAGGRREAYYANLGPGRYLFRVMAANDDGVWSDAGARLDFTIRPMFYQTRWFAALGVLLGVLLVAALFVLRSRQVARRVRGRLEERHAERERIARELHDTLLQGVQGVVLCFQAAAERVPTDSTTRALLERALDRADEVLVEGRDRVRDLRSSDEAGRDLPHALLELGEELAGACNTAFRVVVYGSVRAIDPLVRDELHGISREALVNAFQHARASEIEVEIDYGMDELCLRIRDNGIGIDPAIVAAGGRSGHWGMVGMHERASAMGARMNVWSRPESGTEVEVRVPATVAHGRAKASWTSWMRRLVSGGRET